MSSKPKTYEVKVIPRSSKNLVKHDEGGSLKVYVRAPAQDNKANEALIRLVSEDLNVKRSSVRIIKGARSPRKVIAVL